MSVRWLIPLVLLSCVISCLVPGSASGEDRKVSVYEWGKIGQVRDTISRIMPFEEQVRVLKPYHECRLVCCCERGLCCGHLVPVEILREEYEIATRDRRFMFSPPLECWLGTVKASGAKDKDGKDIVGAFDIDLKEQLTLFDPHHLRFQGSVRPPEDKSIEEPMESQHSKSSWSSSGFTQLAAAELQRLIADKKIKDDYKDTQVLLIWNLAHDIKLPMDDTVIFPQGTSAGGQLASACIPTPGQPIKCDVLSKFTVQKLSDGNGYGKHVRIVLWGDNKTEKHGDSPEFLKPAFEQVKEHFLLEREFRVLRTFQAAKDVEP